jgi:hypothetical protein
MWVLYAIWFVLPGAVAVLAGLSGIRRKQRLRRTGRTAWAMIVTGPAATGPGASVQFELPGGRIVERPCAAPVRRSTAYRPGTKILVWYDPADPEDVLIYGRGGLRADGAFLAAGLLFVTLGAAMVALVR